MNGKRESPNCFNSFATSTKRETVKTVAIDLSFTNTQLKLGVNEKLLSNPLLQVTRTRNYKPETLNPELLVALVFPLLLVVGDLLETLEARIRSQVIEVFVFDVAPNIESGVN